MNDHNQIQKKKRGSIYTPNDFASILAEWAIEDPDAQILDVGVGEGAITLAAYSRLIELGTKAHRGEEQIFGAEVDGKTFREFKRIVADKGLNFPHIEQRDFFKSALPGVDVVIGNPPYVRRSKISNFKRIQRQFDQNGRQISSLADLYIYFILRACEQLRANGKLAIITSDSWLNTRYGAVWKEYLINNFTIEGLISLDRNIFDADVKALITLATKKKPSSNHAIKFIRVKNGLPARKILNSVTNPKVSHQDIEINNVNLDSIDVKETWGIYFKAASLYKLVSNHSKVSTVSEVANTRIGIQTLAKDFFVIKAEDIQKHGIEDLYLKPLIQSSRFHADPVIDKDEKTSFMLLFCDKEKIELEGTNILRYIENGEKAKVSFRGKLKIVEGYNNKERIKKSRRPIWYDLKTAVEKQPIAKILVPRVVAKTYQVYWNKAGYVPGEFFIEFRPNKNIDDEVYLAVLSSSVFEVCLRTKSQLYGGGAYSVFPGQFKAVPIVDPGKLSEIERESLKAAYNKYLIDPKNGRQAIDSAIAKILTLSTEIKEEIENSLNDLVAAVDTFSVIK